MKNLRLLGFAALTVILSATACKNDKAASTDAQSTTEGATTAAAGDVAAAQGTTGEATPPAPTGPTTTVEFEEMVHDFGEVMEGSMVKHQYKFKNTGNEPLVISDAKGSCGCTVPDWPREPVPPGGTGVINVQFDSKGKGSDDGQKQSKRVTVTANTNPAQTYLTISGVVKKDPKAPKAEGGVSH
ncbi:MAG: DUF1573 domain-containing protein [Saprospiraceae bacterium]|nr:DUF1573 domain-containing protein [Saprospiraceae bacterium]